MDEFWYFILKLLAVGFLVLANGFFVAVEFALVSLNRAKVDRLVSEGKASAKLVKRLLEKMDRILAAAQLGITMASLALGWIGELAIASQIEPLFNFIPHDLAFVTSHGVAFVISFTIITVLHIVLGEQAPKIYSIRNPEKISMLTARITLGFEFVFRPLVWVLDLASQLVLRVVGISGDEVDPGQMHSLDDLRLHFVDIHQRGLLSRQQEEMLHSVIEFTELEAKEVMTPRTELISLEENQSIGELLESSNESGHARLPVYREKVENIVGYISVRDVLQLISEKDDALDQSVLSLMHPISYVPENKTVSTLFYDMQRERIPMVAVVNEYSDAEGIVTLNGLAEEIVGQLEDETSEVEPLFERIDRHTIRIEGQLRVDEANEELGMKIPERDEYQTIAGFILYQLQRVPSEGEALRHGNVNLIIDHMEGPRIEKILVQGL
jgi:CBS domain containing-hemolysin-like protein